MSSTYTSIQIEITTGVFVTFAQTEILDAQVVDEGDITGVSMPGSTLEFKVSRADNSLSMFGGDLSTKLTERLPVFCYEFYNGNYQLIGKFYLDTWKNTSNNVMEFTALDIIGVLADTDFEGAFWQNDITLSVALTQIFSLITVVYEIDPLAINNPVSGWIPPGNYRNALQQICFAAGVVAVTSRTDKLLLVPSVVPTFFYSGKITTKTAKQISVELLPLVARIELVSHDYTQSAEVETIFDKTLGAGDHKIIFGKPYYGIVITGYGYVQSVIGTEAGDYLTTEAGDYIEAGGQFLFGSNSVYLHLTESSHIVITGNPWIDSKRSFFFDETGTELLKNKVTLSIADATTINFARAQVVLDKLRDYYRQRYIQKLKILVPSSIKTGDKVLSNTLESQRILSTVESSVMDLTGGFTIEMRLRGFLPAYALPVINPTRRSRTGIAITGAEMNRNNKWRQYASNN